MNHEQVPCQFGTFDVENYGDLLYPLLLGKMLHVRDEARDVCKFSFLGSESLLGTGYASRPVRELLFGRQGQRHLLIVGGGDLLRTDALRMASHYDSIRSKRTEPTVPFSWRRFFRQVRRRPETSDRRFWFRYMHYPAVGPFIIDPDRFSSIEQVAYCSVGVPFAFEEMAKLRVARAMDKASFIYVRDRQSEKKLRDAGVRKVINVAPDLAVMLGGIFDAATERAKGRRILEKLGVNVERPVLCVQSNPQPPENRGELIRQLQAYQARTKCEVVLIPLGKCHGDDIYLRQLAQEAGRAFGYLEIESIFDMISVLASCEVFLGTSLHGNITAFAFGIPHVIGPVAADKCEGFLEVVDLPPGLKLKSWAEANAKLDFVTGLGGEYFRNRAVAARQRVNEVFDSLLGAIDSTLGPL